MAGDPQIQGPELEVEVLGPLSKGLHSLRAGPGKCWLRVAQITGMPAWDRSSAALSAP